MRRILNSFLQFIEQDSSDSLVIAATNNLALLDHALFRRFDDVLYYELPDNTECCTLVKNSLGVFLCDLNIDIFTHDSLKGLSHAEITSACIDAKKEAILSGQNAVEYPILERMLKERHHFPRQ
jgi:SpoVK/Ycf46/Vps4 family AAA+-type ATPase